jgi:hypothetical protein
MDWMRIRIERVARANERPRGHEIVAETCVVCRRRAIETSYRGLCPYCSLAAFLTYETAAQLSRWERAGSLP